MKISAVVCTHNGEKLLSAALRSLITQTLSKQEYEILVVDNASQDNTPDIVRQFAGEPNFRYVFEPRLGLSHARNRGWQEAQGEIVAYLDDDAIACPEWLERIVGVFRELPDAGAVGGKVDPLWEVAPPSWLNEFMQRYLSVLDWSETRIILDGHKYIIGANMAFSRQTLESLTGFSINLGRRGNNLISNEEIELIRKIENRRQHIIYDPQISVQHLIPASRLNSKWFRKRWLAQGISNAILHRHQQLPSKYARIRHAIRLLIYNFQRPHQFVYACFPSVFPDYAAVSHKVLENYGFIFGLFTADKNTV